MIVFDHEKPEIIAEQQRLNQLLPPKACVQPGSGKWVLSAHSLSSKQIEAIAHFLEGLYAQVEE